MANKKAAKKRSVKTAKTKAVQNSDSSNPEAVFDSLQERDQLIINRLVQNTLMSRSQLSRMFTDTRRSIDDDCGYPYHEEMTAFDYRSYYDREAVANRVVEVYPDESWQTQPTILEDEDPAVSTQFEEEFSELDEGLRNESHYKDDEGSPIWEALRRLDIVCGIGSYGVALLGFDDGAPLHEPIDFKTNSGQKLLYMRTFDETLARIAKYEIDPTSPRYGHPNEYHLRFLDYNALTAEGYGGQPNMDMRVHWSRVIHVADNLISSEIFGTPRIQPVFNRIFDLRKLYSGSAEMYWKGALPGLSAETHPQLGGDVELPTDLKDQMWNYQNSLQRILMTTGFEIKSLAPQVVDPTPQINTQLEAICIKLGIPKRIFMGSERGELSSSQDQKAWNKRIMNRQNKFITPRIVAPFIDRLINVGVLSVPKEGYHIQWPESDTLNALDQSTVVKSRTEAMAAYVGGGVEMLMTPMDYLVQELGYEEGEAEAIIKSTTAALEEKVATAVLETEHTEEREDGTRDKGFEQQKELEDIKFKGKQQQQKDKKQGVK